MKIEWTITRAMQVALLAAMMFSLGVAQSPWWLYAIAVFYGYTSFMAGNEVGKRSIEEDGK